MSSRFCFVDDVNLYYHGTKQKEISITSNSYERASMFLLYHVARPQLQVHLSRLAIPQRMAPAQWSSTEPFATLPPLQIRRSRRTMFTTSSPCAEPTTIATAKPATIASPTGRSPGGPRSRMRPSRTPHRHLRGRRANSTWR